MHAPPVPGVPARGPGYGTSIRWALWSLALGCLAPAQGTAQFVQHADSALLRRWDDAVLRSNPDLVARRIALDAARARADAVGFAPPAVLSVNVEEMPDAINLSAGNARLELSREFPAWGSRAASRGMAAREVERAELVLALVERGVRARAGQWLAGAAGARAIARRLAAEDSLLASVDEAVRTRFALADARYVDVLRIRTERLRVQSGLAQALSDERISRMGLIALIAATVPGLSVADLVDSLIAGASLDPLPGPLPDAPPLDALVDAAAPVRLAQLAIARAEAARGLVRAGQRPRLTAALGAQRFARDGGGHDVGLTLGGAISLPFTAGRANRLAALAADQEVRGAGADHELAVVETRAVLGAVRERYQAARRRFGTYAAALLQGARDERESALSAYRSGTLSLLELLDFERALARAEIDRYRSVVEAANAFAALLGAGAITSRSSDVFSTPATEHLDGN